MSSISLGFAGSRSVANWVRPSVLHNSMRERYSGKSIPVRLCRALGLVRLVFAGAPEVRYLSDSWRGRQGEIRAGDV